MKKETNEERNKWRN